MELVGASQGFDHLSALEVVQADRAAVLLLLSGRRILLLLLKLKAWDGVNNVLDLLRRWQRNTILVYLLGLLLVIVLVAVELLLLLEVLLEVLSILRHTVEEELLILPIRRVGVALLSARLSVEHAIEIHVYAWVLRLKLTQHVLDVAHDPLQVYEVGVLTIWLLLLLLRVLMGRRVSLLLLLRARRVRMCLLLPMATVPTVHVCVGERLRRVAASLARPPRLLFLLVNGPLHKVVLVLVSPPSLLLRMAAATAVAISLVIGMTRVSLLYELLIGIELSSNVLNFIVSFNVVVGSVVYQFVAIVVVTLLVILLAIHAWTWLVSCILISSGAQVLARGNHLALRIVRF
jgi:hypothetical protein